MKKFIYFALGIYAYWYSNSLAIALLRKNGYDPKYFEGFWSRSADFAESRNNLVAEMIGYQKVTEEAEDLTDPDDFDWEHIRVTVG